MASSAVQNTSKLHSSPSHLPEKARLETASWLNQSLADGLDLASHLKVAHWNVKGPHFMPLHELFERIYDALDEQNDIIAERAVTLGALALGTSRHVAQSSRLPQYPQETVRGSEHVQNLVDRFGAYLGTLRSARDVAESNADTDTVDLLTVAITEAEKHSWFLRATATDA